MTSKQKEVRRKHRKRINKLRDQANPKRSGAQKRLERALHAQKYN